MSCQTIRQILSGFHKQSHALSNQLNQFLFLHMAINNVMDVVDAILSLIQCIADIERLDINISIGMVCRIIFFVIVIILRDLKSYPLNELIAQIVAWLVFHIYILYLEKDYFSLGESKIFQRERNFKIMDTLQLIIGTTYLACTLGSTLEILALVFFSINLFCNCCELIYIQFIRKTHSNDYSKQGGYKEMYFGFFLGSIGVIIFLISSASKYSSEIRESGTLGAALYLTIIGEILVVIFSFFFFCSHRESISCASDWTKRILALLYGLNVGCFSIFYGFLTGVAALCYLIYSICKKKEESNDREKVPTS
ncbi:unnamed protein product (macronuclear) [Paramecium tetraurelia]|uniref:Uncharacterized protein n=1 Tax=Paramecium tetraurelia TaxID=5888 RepID=A0EE44_PARTE|nr:uncharacterized protein GSPATT00025905001 [Paramecium tetraurelia]CAK93561.1 unnamed protein product [Paramecium tetraurelia]|eukprot:XP_001460958.1 hypothetical protein (macronuclear) [Paramecium tetraurelia strain d4-2]